MISWSTDGTEPIYLCEQHAKQLASSAPRAEVRSVGRYEETEATAETGPVALPQKSLPPLATKSATANSHRKPTAPPESLAERCAAIDRQIGELASQMESILSQSEATIDPASTIDAPLEQVILEIIGNPAMNDTQKDAAITRLGEIQKSLKQAVGQGMTLLEAHRIKRSLAGCLSGEIGASEEAKAAYRAVHDRIQQAMHTAMSQRENSFVSA
jgi:hypothetical protein